MSPHLCQYCRTITPTSISPHIDPVTGEGNFSHLHHPTFAALEASASTCQLCALFLDALKRANVDDLAEVPTSYMAHEKSYIWLLANNVGLFDDVREPKGLSQMAVSVGYGVLKSAQVGLVVASGR